MGYSILSVESDAKTVKGSRVGVLTGIFYGAPHTTASKKSLCPFASEACIKDCLYNSGLAQVYPKINLARIRKTKLFLENPDLFFDLLDKDISALVRAGKRRNMFVAVRLNGTTDILFERIQRARAIMAKYSDVQFYDYTKIPIRYRTNRPSNYHLTFSLSETNVSEARDALALGVNVAVVFKTKNFPQSFLDVPVIDGDASDLRFMDTAPVVVGLKLKGNAQRKRNTGLAN